MIRIFERAGYQNYADEVRKITQTSDSDSSGSGEEQSPIEQPQTYPPYKQQALFQNPPEKPKLDKTCAYVIVDQENLPKGKS